MDFVIEWLLFPLLMVAVLAGCGLLLRSATATAIPSALLPAAGLAVMICAGHLTTAFDATAELTTPVIVALAVAGYLTASYGGWRRGIRSATVPAAAGLAAFLAFGAPVILSGESTFAGYLKLDDTATWLALTDRVMEHGRSLDGLAPSTYEATLAFNLGDGYPPGAFVPPGVGSQIVATDPAWVFQPYISLLGGVLAAAMTELVKPLVRSATLRAGVAFVAAQPALLVGYALWGGIKEMEAVVLIALAAGLAGILPVRPRTPVAVVPLAVAASALLAVLSLGGVVWLLPILLVPLYLLRRVARLASLVAMFAAVSLVILLPLLAGGELLPPTSSPLTSAAAKGNLLEPLSPFQVFGIWPVGDFRLRPDEGLITAVAIVVAACTAALAIAGAARRRARGLILYWAAAALGAAVLVVVGSPWVEGKALATASPAVALAAVAGLAFAFERGLRVEAGLAALVVVGGILVSNALGYRDAFLAPRDQLTELEEIGERIEGEGPALITEYNPYGARHFLRGADPEGASELRRRIVPLREGGSLDKGLWADTDDFALDGLLVYRTLVLRRSPEQSRPPLPYSLVTSGRYYEVWQREPGPAGRFIHAPLGEGTEPSAIPPCSQIRELAGQAGLDGSIAYVERPANVVVPSERVQWPSEWLTATGPPVRPTTAGSAATLADLPDEGARTIWLGGSVRGEMEALIDGEPAGSARHFINNNGLYLELGRADLAGGSHAVELRYGGTDLHPGSGGRPFPIGPLVLAPSEPTDVVNRIPATRATEACGRRLDWIAAIPGPSADSAEGRPG